jgi:YD repeat-containing protein
MIIIESDDEGNEKKTTVNAIGKTKEVVAKDVLGQWVGKSYQYDKYDRQFKESEPAIGGSYTQWNETFYDYYASVKQVDSFTGKTTSITYDGLITTVNDRTKSVITTKNGLGNVVSTQDPGGTINNTYYANGNLKSADMGGSVQTIVQDGWGRKTSLTDPSAGLYTYTYNEWGETTVETTPKGSTTYTYDANGKALTKKIRGDNTDMSYQYTYDASSKMLTALNLTNSDGNNASYAYTYDSYKRLIGTVEDNLHAQFTKTLTYDSFGRINTETSEAKNKANNKVANKTLRNNYQYGQIKDIFDNVTGRPIWQISTLNARGQVTAALLGISVKETSVFDQYGFLQEIKTACIATSPAELMKLSFSFDTQRGNLNSRSNSAFAWNETFLPCDNLDRLTGFTDNNGTQTQKYDGSGRIIENSKLGNYVYAGNSYQQTGLNNLTPAAASYYLGRPKQTITYNAFKSPVEIADQGKDKIAFQYNAALGRAHMYYGNDNADKMQRRYRRHYSEDGSMEITVDIVSNATNFVIYLGGDAYSAPAIYKEVHTATATAKNVYFLHRDYLGSILMITDEDGGIKEKRHFDAWGNIVKLTDGNGTALTAFAILDRG